MMDREKRSSDCSAIKIILASSIFSYRRLFHNNTTNNTRSSSKNNSKVRKTTSGSNNFISSRMNSYQISFLIYISIILLSTKIPLTSCEGKFRSQENNQLEDEQKEYPHLYHHHHHHGENSHLEHNIPFQCNHVYPKPDEVILGAMPESEPYHVIRKRSIDQPLRIVLHYDESVYQLEKQQLDLINNTVLPQALEYWERALKVRRTETKILLNRRCPHVSYKVKNT